MNISKRNCLLNVNESKSLHKAEEKFDKRKINNKIWESKGRGVVILWIKDDDKCNIDR